MANCNFLSIELSFAQQNFIPKAFINGTIILHYKFEQSGIPRIQYECFPKYIINFISYLCITNNLDEMPSEGGTLFIQVERSTGRQKYLCISYPYRIIL